MSLSSIPAVPDIHDAALTARLQHRLDTKTKPLGSLGRLEALALQLGQVLGTETPQLEQPQMIVFAADHGLTARGISAFPSDVTWQMVENFLSGGAAVSVLARQHGIALTVADCGVRYEFGPREGLVNFKIAPGTRDSSEGPAMSAAECEQAMVNGRALVSQLPGNVVLLGEMGIGNTSAAAMLLSRLVHVDIAHCTGAGTGLDPDAVLRKAGILREVLQHHRSAITPLGALAAFGGFEIAAMTGAALQAAEERRIVVVDGFISTAAIMVAHALQPHVLQRCVFAHRSGERGHALMLKHMRAEPLLDMGLRLGEGSGAALAWPLLQSACAILRDMASFEAAEVSEKL